MSNKKINVHIFFSPIENESRLMKETGSLIGLKLVDEVFIVGKGENHLPKYQDIDAKRHIIRAPMLTHTATHGSFKRKIIALIRLIQYGYFALWTIIRLRPYFISCHNLMLLPLGVIAKFLSGAKLIYVPHELETERTGLKGYNKRLSKINEKLFIRFANKVMVVCPPIAEWYQKEYALSQVYVLPNVPYNAYVDAPLSKKKHFRQEFGIPDEHIICIYQGVIDQARGSFELINNFKEIKPNKHLVMMGYGDMVSYVKEAADKYPNIHYKPAVPTEEIIHYSSSADVGFNYLPFPVSMSYRFSLPNKFFEYLIGGLPIIVSNSLEYLSNIIRDNNLGWVISHNKQEFIDFINNLDKDQIVAKKEPLMSYAKRSGWQFEEKILEQVYC